MRYPLLIIGLVLPLIALPAYAFDALEFGPYIQIESSNRALICAQLDQEAEARVVLEKAGEIISTVALKGSRPSCAAFTDLQPGVSYGYRLVMNGREVTNPEHPPVFVTESLGRQSLAILGDTRSGDDSFDLEHRRVIKTITESAFPEALIHTGDFVERDETNLWRNFFLIESELLATTPIYPAIGRSDRPAEMMRRLFSLLNANGYYSFDRGEAHFTVLHLHRSASQPDRDTATDGAQANWLRWDLAGARQRGARYLFVVMHEPPFGLAGRTPRAIREVFLPIFEMFGVTAVFSGAHHFSHKVHGSVHYLTNGGGGAMLEAGEPRPGVFHFYRATHHFLLLEWGPGGALLKAIDDQGNIFYELALDNAAVGSANPLNAPTVIRSYPGGTNSVPLTVFHDPAKEGVDKLKDALPQIAVESSAMLVVTFRSLDHPDNRALFEEKGFPPEAELVALIGDKQFYGLEQIRRDLPQEAASQAQRSSEDAHPWGSTMLWLGFSAALLFLIGSFLMWRRKR